MWNVDLYSNLKEISGITVTVKNSDWRSNNLAEIVGNGKVVSCLTVGICTSRMSQPLDVVDIEVIKNSNLGFWILLEKSIIRLEIISRTSQSLESLNTLVRRKEGKSSF